MIVRHVIKKNNRFWVQKEKRWTTSLRLATLFPCKKSADNEKVGDSEEVYVSEDREGYVRTRTVIKYPKVYCVAIRCDVTNTENHSYFYDLDKATQYAKKQADLSVHNRLSKFVEIDGHGVDNVHIWFENKFHDQILVKEITVA